MVNADQVESEQDVEYLDEGDIPLVGSARSVNGIDLMKVFEYIKSKEPKIFVACGGHAVAAGATIKYRDLRLYLVKDVLTLIIRPRKKRPLLVSANCLMPIYA